MGEEKTIEQLEAEYKALLLDKLNREKKEAEELEKKKQAEELTLQKQREKEELKEEIKKEMGFTKTSRLEDTEKKTVNMTSDRSFETFKAGFIDHMQKKGLPMKGRRYEDLVETLSYGKEAM